VWQSITDNNQWLTNKTRTYSGTALAFASQQPRYIVELVPPSPPPSGTTLVTGKGINSGSQTTTFRVTARGWGQQSQTQASVQAAINY
jgi:hypothetical protein